MVLTGLEVVGRLRVMFERFTNRARHVVVLAQDEARLLDHNYIGTEHILLGLVGEPESIGGKVLADFGFTREGSREEVERRGGPGQRLPRGPPPLTPPAEKNPAPSPRAGLPTRPHPLRHRA